MQLRGIADGKFCILIVDDSLTVRMDLRDTFVSAGFAASTAETLAAARAALTEQSFSLVVLDVLLPDGDGVDLLREIKSTSSIPVMLLSTEAEVRDRVRGLKTGADDYIGKPYDGGYVLARARQLIGTAQHLPKPLLPGILLIDDSPTFREEFKRVLEEAGYIVATAATGEEGLNTAFALRPDAIVVDGLLDGIDGPTVIRRVKQDVTLRNTPCLLLTGSLEPVDETRVLDAGADAYLLKRTDVNVILARIAALLRSGTPSRVVQFPASSLLATKKILAVDDSITFLQEVSTQLREEGYDTVLGASGKEALELLEIQAVDCILLDVQMPGLSGNETCRIIKNHPAWRNIPLLLLTAAEEPEAVVEGMNAGADDCIHKSSDFALLKARIRAQLRRKQFEDEDRALREALLHKELEIAQAQAAKDASYRSLIQSAPCGILRLCGRKGRLLEVNAAFSQTLGYTSPAELIESSVAGGIVLDEELLKRLAEGAGQDGKVIETEVEWRRKDGMLCIASLDGYMRRFNRAWGKTLGFNATELGSQRWIEFVHPDDRERADAALLSLQSGFEISHLEVRFLSKSGDYRWLVGSATPALEQGVVFAAMNDITERKVLEEQLRSQNVALLEEQNRRANEASRLKSEFLANMSHELRSPLNGILGFTELLYDGKFGSLPERPRGFVGRIHSSASHLLQLINGVLDLSKVEAGHMEFRPERVSVSSVIREVTGILSSLTSEKQIRMETEIDHTVDNVLTDPGKLKQILHNYLSNALKFTGPKGRVVVRLKSAGPAEFRLEVSDTGVGIAEKDFARLFVEFQQLDASTAKRYQGTGLGLALTKRIVEAQGGRVGVESKLGQGSTFFAVLPRAPRMDSGVGVTTRSTPGAK